MSVYAEFCGDVSCGSDVIIPMTEKGAMKWAEEHLTADEYMKLFELEE